MKTFHPPYTTIKFIFLSLKDVNVSLKMCEHSSCEYPFKCYIDRLGSNVKQKFFSSYSSVQDPIIIIIIILITRTDESKRKERENNVNSPSALVRNDFVTTERAGSVYRHVSSNLAAI